MSSTDDDNTESFSSAAIRAFSFLTDEYGYAGSAETDDVAVFSNCGIELEIFREPGSFTIYVQIAREPTGDAYVLHEIVSALGVNESRNAQCRGASRTEIDGCLARLCNLCREYLPGILTGSPDDWQRVEAAALTDAAAYTLNCQFGPTLDRANAAWIAKDWELARRLYEHARPALGPAELRRLEFLIRSRK